jgi:hypothetical protein
MPGVDDSVRCHGDEVDERDVVSKPEVLASISLPFVEARAWLMRPRCLENLGPLRQRSHF